MKKNGFYILLTGCCIACLLQSCSLAEKLGSNAGAGIATKTDTIGRNLIAGIREELTNQETSAKLKRFIDSLITNITDTFAEKGKKAEDSLLNPKILRWADSLVAALTGNQLKMNVEALQSSLVGKTKKDVLDIRNSFEQLLKEILSTDTRGKVGLLRDELLGPKTTAALSKIIDTAVTHIVDSSLNMVSQRLHNDFNPLVKQDISFIQHYAIGLLIALGAIAAVIIFIVWRNKQKYLRMLAIVTKQVNDIPDQHVYDQVTAKIKNDTVTAGLEADLREVLAKNGLINTGQWVKKMQ